MLESSIGQSGHLESRAERRLRMASDFIFSAINSSNGEIDMSSLRERAKDSFPADPQCIRAAISHLEHAGQIVRSWTGTLKLPQQATTE